MWKATLYTAAVLILAFSAVVGAGATVVARDPEARVSRERLMYAPDYISKPIMMESARYDALLLGSSRFMEIDPNAINGVEAYNGAFGGVTPENMLEFLELHASRDTVIVLGLDLYMMNELHTPLQQRRWTTAQEEDRTLFPRILRAALPQTFESERVISERDYVLNLGTLARTLAGQNAGIRTESGSTIPVTNANGQIFNAGKLIVDHVCRRPLKPPQCAIGLERAIGVALSGHFAEFRYSDARVETFRQMRALLDERDVRYVVIVNPEHEAFWPVVHGERLNVFSERFRADVAESFDHVCDNFTQENANEALYYATDPFHYLPDTGSRMVNECLAQYGIVN